MLFIVIGALSWVAAEETEEIVLRVDGMMCSGCEATVRYALQKVDGVKEVYVSYLKGEARVKVIKGKVTAEDLIESVNKSGFGIYRASLASSGRGAGDVFKFKVEGISGFWAPMRLRALLGRIPGVGAVEVDAQTKTVIVEGEAGRLEANDLIRAIEGAGEYRATLVEGPSKKKD
ncbi:MAG: heavy-metal-associated domain-containing protein [bacterium]